MNIEEVVPKIELNKEECMDVNRRALAFLESCKKDVTILDVGCSRGSLSDYVKNRGPFNFQKVFIVGIDPIRHNGVENQYDALISAALDNVDTDDGNPKYANFYLNKDDQASSLLEMDFDNISDNLADRDEKYYVEWAGNLGTVSTHTVPVFSLKSVMQAFFKDKRIEFLKIDAEGKDLDIIKSGALSEMSDPPLFISMECSSHRNKPSKRIFKGGCHKDEVIEFMSSINYSVLDCFDYEFETNNLTQMSDIVFAHNSIEEWKNSL